MGDGRASGGLASWLAPLPHPFPLRGFWLANAGGGGRTVKIWILSSEKEEKSVLPFTRKKWLLFERLWHLNEMGATDTVRKCHASQCKRSNYLRDSKLRCHGSFIRKQYHRIHEKWWATHFSFPNLGKKHIQASCFIL